MRKLFKSTNLIKILLASFLLSLSVYAKAPRGVVSATKGNVFLLANGTMKQLHMGDYLYELDEVFSPFNTIYPFCKNISKENKCLH